MAIHPLNLTVPEKSFPKVFIVGCPRSGTTWLKSMISLHPRVISPNSESHIYSIIYNPVHTQKATRIGFKRRWKLREWFLKKYGILPMLFGAQSKDIWKGILNDYRNYQRGSVNSPGIHNLVEKKDFQAFVNEVLNSEVSEVDRAQALIEKVLRHFYENNSDGRREDVFLEKTPLHIKYAKEILLNFSDAKIIEVVRDGRDVSVSMKSRALTQKWASKNNRKNISMWKRCINKGREVESNEELKDRFYSVRYEDLKADTSFYLKEIFDFMKLDYENSRLYRIDYAAVG